MPTASTIFQSPSGLEQIEDPEGGLVLTEHTPAPGR